MLFDAKVGLCYRVAGKYPAPILRE